MKQVSNVLVQEDEFNKDNLPANTSQPTSVARFAQGQYVQFNFLRVQQL